MHVIDGLLDGLAVPVPGKKSLQFTETGLQRVIQVIDLFLEICVLNGLDPVFEALHAGLDLC